ncbi:hypothetical protein GGF41_002551, partial [Coemansia sp. RSA 2531]
MQTQTPPAPGATMPPTATDTLGASAAGLTREKIRDLILEIQALRLRGATEENNTEYAKLMQLLR